jgi:hypothetical protein
VPWKNISKNFLLHFNYEKGKFALMKTPAGGEAGE